MLESVIEQALVKKIKSMGGTCEKFVSPGRRSVPDRIVTLTGGVIIFVELKAPHKKPSILQQRDHDKRRSLGAKVLVIDSLEQVRDFEALC